MSKTAYLGIGGNIGDVKSNIEASIDLLNKNEKISVTNTSSYYKTEPVGYEEQDWFVNVVVEIGTELEPYELLDYCQHIEQELKRVRLIRWGPRTIDVDILLYEEFTSEDQVLTVPHPRMVERAFALMPLYEIAKDITIYEKPISTWVEELDGEEIVKL